MSSGGGPSVVLVFFVALTHSSLQRKSHLCTVLPRLAPWALFGLRVGTGVGLHPELQNRVRLLPEGQPQHTADTTRSHDRLFGAGRGERPFLAELRVPTRTLTRRPRVKGWCGTGLAQHSGVALLMLAAACSCSPSPAAPPAQAVAQ